MRAQRTVWPLAKKEKERAKKARGRREEERPQRVKARMEEGREVVRRRRLRGMRMRERDLDVWEEEGEEEMEMDVGVGKGEERSERMPKVSWPRTWPMARRARRKAPMVGERERAAANWGRNIVGR